jgi:diguanylate cyclase (GGDEF)-like protein
LDERKTRVLAIDDSAFFRQMLQRSLEESGYVAVLARDGQEALRLLETEIPDIVIVDLTLPDIDGLEVCRRIRKDPMTTSVPLLVLTSLDEPGIEVEAIDAGADDFITKPIDPRVLDARIKMIIRRMRRERMASPLTGLPGNIAIEQDVSRRLDLDEEFCLNYADLDNFKYFNDRYGYSKGDELLLFTSRVISTAVQALGDRGDFVGHLGGDDFVYVTAPGRAEAIAMRVIDEFDAQVPELYDQSTRKRGHFTAIDRRGHSYQVPIVTISIAMVDRDARGIQNSTEMADRLVELKRYAKGQPGSSYVTERRRSAKPAPPEDEPASAEDDADPASGEPSASLS